MLIDDIVLPDDLIWIDEYVYSPVKQALSYAVDGELIIEPAAQQAGRPITLKGGDDYGWIDRATLEYLRLKQAEPGLVMILTLRSVEHSVIFAQPGIEASPIIDYSIPGADDAYTATLKFIEIQ